MTAPRNMRRAGLSRRAFLQTFGIAASAFALPWHLPPLRRTLVSLHMDRPYISVDGTALPYDPRTVLDGAGALASLNETELRMRYPYL